jgi:glutamine---fructose-6-phosphate transaminase (isomerizing)
MMIPVAAQVEVEVAPASVKWESRAANPRRRLSISQIEQVKARGGIVIAVATEGDDFIATKADHVLYVPRASELLTPVLTVVPLQLLAYHIAVRRGADVDQPRNLAKSVTVE